MEAVGTSIEELKHISENKNTKRNTSYWTYLLRKKEEIESCEVSQLNEALAEFFAEQRMESGEE